MMRCRLVRQWMAEFATDGLDPAREAAFREHLAACPRCAAEWRAVEEVEPLLALVPRDLPDPATQRMLHERLAAALATEPMLPVPRRGAWAAAGAFACLLLGGVIGLRALSSHRPETAAVPAPQVASAPVAEAPLPTTLPPSARAHHEVAPGPKPAASPVRVAAAPTPVPAAGAVRPPRLARAPRTGLRHSPRREPVAAVRVASLPSRRNPILEERVAVMPERPTDDAAATPAPAPAPAPPPVLPTAVAAAAARDASPVVRVALAAPVVRASSRSTFALRAVAEAPRPRAGLHVEPAVIESEVVPATELAMRELDR